MQSHPVYASSLLKSILFQRWPWRFAILGVSLVSAVLGILAPYAQKQFVDHLPLEYGTQSWIATAFFLTFGAHGMGLFANWLATRESLITQKSLADVSYSRVLEGPGGLIGHRPAGEAVSLFAVDVPGAAALLDQALVMAGAMLFPLLLAPVALHQFFGIPWLFSFSAIGCLTIINYVLAKKQTRFFYSFKQFAAERTGLVSEWIQNIRTLRILGWMSAVESKIFAVRTRETANRLRMVTNGQFMNSIATSGTYILNILCILLLVQLRKSQGVQPTSGELLSLLWILGVFLARPLRQFPWALVIGMDSYSSMVRLQRALQVPIEQPEVVNQGKHSVLTVGRSEDDSLALEVRGMRFESNGEMLLKNVDLLLKKGEFVALVGEVGSGKSLILQSLMGAVGAKFDGFALNGQWTKGPIDSVVRSQMAFVPQDGFTMSASLGENVAFTYSAEQNHLGLDLIEDQKRQILKSLHLAQFVPEKERVLHGLKTEIGERGVNLSGGQRQRVSIARAHSSDRGIVLLDDCLSALDVDTEVHLVNQLICGEWKNLTRLIATHRMGILPKCDRVLFVEYGQVTEQGTYSKLYDTVPRFREFVRRGEVRG